MNEKLETPVNISDQIFLGLDDLEITGNKQIIIEITNQGAGMIQVKLVQASNIVRSFTKNVAVGETATMIHSFKVRKTTGFSDDLLPLKINYKGQDYYLRKTKAEKLILTK